MTEPVPPHFPKRALLDSEGRIVWITDEERTALVFQRLAALAYGQPYRSRILH